MIFKSAAIGCHVSVPIHQLIQSTIQCRVITMIRVLKSKSAARLVALSMPFSFVFHADWHLAAPVKLVF